MDNLNLPPFYVGQKVVCICPEVYRVWPKGQTFTVADNGKCLNCGEWHTAIKETVLSHIGNIDCTFCRASTSMKSGIFMGTDSKSFAPIQENFQSISLEQVLELETPLISVN